MRRRVVHDRRRNHMGHGVQHGALQDNGTVPFWPRHCKASRCGKHLSCSADTLEGTVGDMQVAKRVDSSSTHAPPTTSWQHHAGLVDRTFWHGIHRGC